MPRARNRLARYYASWWRASRGLPPRDDAELHAWCYRQLMLLWTRSSMVGTTLGGFLTDSSEGKQGLGVLAARFPRVISLLFLGWPLVSVLLSRQKSLADWWNNWRAALERPDLFLAVGRGPYSETDARETLSCLLHIIVGIHQYNHAPSPGFELDDKAAFHRLCVQHGLATVPLVGPSEVVPERAYIAKPMLSTQGRGIFKVMGHEVVGRVDFRTHILQPLLVNPSALARVAGPGAGLCTLRVNTLGTKYGEARVFGAFLRLARAGSLIDNFHAGGIACPVDLRTATVKAGAIEANKRARWRDVMSLRVHPDTGVPFADQLRVPHFNEALALCEAAHRAMGPELLFCSWDVALTDEGPLLVEAGSCLAGALEMLHRPDVRLYMDTLRERVVAMPEFVARSRRVEGSSCLEVSSSKGLRP